jgi:transposase
MDIEDHLIELERRRKQAMRLLASGVRPAEVARRVGVSRQSVLRWSKLHAGFYFRFFPGSIKSPQIVEFLKALQATIGRKILIIWDRLQAHRSRLVKDYVEEQSGALALEYLPAYAPELNPVEYIWSYLKHHAMPNYCANDLGDLRQR